MSDTAKLSLPQTVHQPEQTDAADRRLDRILAGKWGILVMLLLLGLVLWLTIVGANYPSAWLSARFFPFTGLAFSAAGNIHTPHWLHSLLIDGIYNVLTCVIAVMLPPMAIFFPLFTLLRILAICPVWRFIWINHFSVPVPAANRG